MIPEWLHLLSLAALILGAICSVTIAADEVIYPQHMWIMNIVWPVTALFGSVITLWAYFKYGRLATHDKALPAIQRGEQTPSKKFTPFSVSRKRDQSLRRWLLPR